MRISPLDTPNLVLVLHREVELGLWLGRKKTTRCIAVYVGNPDALARELWRRR